jgi:hypothetical protein
MPFNRKANVQVRAVSAEVRSRLRKEDILRGEDVTLTAVTTSGHNALLPLAEGDRIRFLTRVKIGGFEAINGTEAKIEAIHRVGDQSFQFVVRTDAGRFTFSPDQVADDKGWVKIAHANGSTIHGAQGLTTDCAFVWLSPQMDRHDILSRQVAPEKQRRFFLITRRSIPAY